MNLKKVLFIVIILTVFFQIYIPKERDSTIKRIDDTLNEDYSQYNNLERNLPVNQQKDYFLIIIPKVMTSGTTFWNNICCKIQPQSESNNLTIIIVVLSSEIYEGLTSSLLKTMGDIITLNVKSNLICLIYPLTVFSRKDKTISETFKTSTSELHSQINAIIQNEPGIHFNEICRELNRKNGVINYHLDLLEKNDEIIRFNDGYFTQYYPITMDLSEECFKMLSLLKRSTIEKIITILISDTSRSYSRRELANINGITPQAVSNNMKILISEKLVNEKTITRQKYYNLTGKALDLLKELRFNNNFLNRYV